MSFPTSVEPVKESLRTPGVRAERGAAVLAVAGQDIEHRRRQVLLTDTGEHEHPERRVLRRLEHQSVAGAQGRRNLERRQQHRGVPRDDGAHHPDGLPARIAQHVLAEGEGLALELARETAEVAEDVRRQSRLPPRLGAERIAGLGGDGARNILDLRLDGVGDAEQHPAAVARRHVAPARERLGRGLHRPIDVLGARARHVGEDAPVRGVLHGDGLAGSAVDALAAEQHPVSVGNEGFLHWCGALMWRWGKRAPP